MKAHQRKVFNKLKAALKAGRKLGLEPTAGDIYLEDEDWIEIVDEDGVIEEEPITKHYACAFGAMAAGLGIEAYVMDNADDLYEPMAKALGVDTDCIVEIYVPIFTGNDTGFKGEMYDEGAIKYLEDYLNKTPEVC